MNLTRKMRLGGLGWLLLAALTGCDDRAAVGADAGVTDLGLDPQTLGGVPLGLAIPEGGSGIYLRESTPVLRRLDEGLAVFWTEYASHVKLGKRTSLRFQRLDASGRMLLPWRGKELATAPPAVDQATSVYNVQVSREEEPWAITWNVGPLTYGGIFDRNGALWQRSFEGVETCFYAQRSGSAIAGMCASLEQMLGGDLPLYWLQEGGSVRGPQAVLDFVTTPQTRGSGIATGLLDVYHSLDWKGLAYSLLPMGASERQSTTFVTKTGPHSLLVETGPKPVGVPFGALRYLALYRVVPHGASYQPADLWAVGFDERGEIVPLAGQPQLFIHTHPDPDYLGAYWVTAGKELHVVDRHMHTGSCTYARKGLDDDQPANTFEFESVAACKGGSFRAPLFAGDADGFTVLTERLRHQLGDTRYPEQWRLVLEGYDGAAKLRYSKVLHSCTNDGEGCFEASAYDILPDGQGGAYVLWGVPRHQKGPVLPDGWRLAGEALLIQRFDRDGKPLWPVDASK